MKDTRFSFRGLLKKISDTLYIRLWPLMAYFLALIAFLFMLIERYGESMGSAIMAGFTIAYVVATFYICKANIKSANASKEQLEETRNQFRESQRNEKIPYLYATITDKWVDHDPKSPYPNMWLLIKDSHGDESAGCKCNLRITNIGLGTAVNIKCKWAIDGKEVNKDWPTKVLKCEGSMDNNIIVEGSYVSETASSKSGVLLFEFEDLLGNKYEQRLELSFNILGYSVSIVSYDMKSPRYREEDKAV